MNLLPGQQKVTGDSIIGPSGMPIRVFCVELVSGGTLSTCILKNGTTSSGAAWAQIDGIASSSVTKNYGGGLLFPAGCFFDADANISYANVIFTTSEG